jgi:site-specific recombinase XerD
VALVPSDVDTRTGTVHVRNGKGGHSRRVGIDGDALAMLRRWLERRKTLGLGGRQPLFCSLKGAPLDTSYLRRLIPRLATEAGIDKRVHPHALRHTRAAELAADGVPVNVIQRVLGHSSLATTDRYLAHVAPTQVLDVMASGWRLSA